MNQYDLKFVADAESELYIDGEWIAKLSRGEIYKVTLPEGEYVIQAKTKNPLLRYKELINHIKHRVLEISFTNVVNEKLDIRRRLQLYRFIDGDTNKQGYIDVASRVIVIPAKFEYVCPFYGGMAVVQSDSKWGIINDLGSFIFQPSYSYIKPVSKEKDCHLPDYYILYNDEGDGIIDSLKNWIISPSDGIRVTNIHKCNWKNYFICQNRANKYAIHDGDKFMTKFVFDEIICSESCFICKQNSDKESSKYSFIRLINNSVYYSFADFVKLGPFNKCGYAYAEIGNSKGWVNTSGKYVFIPKDNFDDYGDFDGKYALVSKEGKVSYIDTNDNLLLPFIYDSASPFCEGRALVMKNNLFGLIDDTGNELCPCVYTSFKKPGVSCMGFPLAQVSLDGRYGCIDRDGKVVIPCIYLKINFIKNNIIALTDDEGVHFVNNNNEVITQKSNYYLLLKNCMDYTPEKRFLRPLNSWVADSGKCKFCKFDKLVGRKDRKCGLLNFKNEIVLPFEYRYIHDEGADFHYEYYEARKPGIRYDILPNGEVIDVKIQTDM